MTGSLIAVRPREGFKLDPGHSPNCMFEHREADFIVHDGWEHRDKLGRKGNGATWWQRFTCNDPDCSATLLVRYDVLNEFVKAGLRGN